MKRSRRWGLGILAALCLGAGALALERTCYPVEPDLSGLETGLQDFWMRGRPAGAPPEMLVHQHLPVGDRIYVLVEVGPELDLGTAALERSWTGRWRVGYMRWGGGNVREEVVETGGRQYILLGGRNTGEQIVSAAFTLDGTAYQVEIPRQPRFLVCTEVDGRTEAAHLDLGTLTWYNAQGGEVTVDYIRPVSGE